MNEKSVAKSSMSSPLLPLPYQKRFVTKLINALTAPFTSVKWQLTDPWCSNIYIDTSKLYIYILNYMLLFPCFFSHPCQIPVCLFIARFLCFCLFLLLFFRLFLCCFVVFCLFLFCLGFFWKVLGKGNDMEWV